MQINLPDDLANKIRQRTSGAPGVTEIDVIREALDSLDWRDAERLAIQEGIRAMEEERMRPFEEFDREFRERNKIAPES
jgi:hypothetical protein